MLKKPFSLAHKAFFISLLLSCMVSYSMQSNLLYDNLVRLKTNLEDLQLLLSKINSHDIEQFVASLANSSRPLPLMQRALEQVVALPPLPPRDDVILSALEIEEEQDFKNKLQKLMDTYSQKGQLSLLVKQLSSMITAVQQQMVIQTILKKLKDRPLPPIPRPLPKIPTLTPVGKEPPMTVQAKRIAAAQALQDIAAVLALRRQVIAPDEDEDGNGEFEFEQYSAPELSVTTEKPTSGGFVPLDIVLEKGSRKFFESDEEPPSDEDGQEWEFAEED